MTGSDTGTNPMKEEADRPKYFHLLSDADIRDLRPAAPDSRAVARSA